MGAFLQLIPFVLKILKGLGIIKDPVQEKEFQLKLLALAQQREIAEAEEFSAFIKATSPDAQWVPRWINGLQAATRPLITWIILGSIIASFFISGLAARITDTLQAFSRAGTAGLLLIAIPAWWFFGRSIEKIVPGMAVLRNGNGNGAQPAAPLPGSARPERPGSATPQPSKVSLEPPRREVSEARVTFEGND